MKQIVDIPEFFSDKTVLITGGTGFLGKCLVEKLLRDCPKVKRILLIIRTKKGEGAQERFREYFASRAFDRIRESRGGCEEKLGLLSGDITLPNCDLAPHDLESINSVQVLIHSAAAISFQMPLAKIVKLNVGGTKNVLDLALTMPGIQAFVYVSTAYCMPGSMLVEEKVYPTEMTPQEALTTFEALPQEWMAFVTPMIIGERNSYQYSKHLAEKLVDSYKNELPVCIVRPGAILAAHKEPFPGWNDTNSMISTYFSVCSRGDANTYLTDASTPMTVTPADVTVNTVLAAAWNKLNLYVNYSLQNAVYNCIPVASNPLSQIEMRKWAYASVIKCPPSGLVAYPWTVLTNSYLLFTLRQTFFRGIPALVGSMLGKKVQGMPCLEAFGRGKQLITLYAKFASVKRSFTTENMSALSCAMSPGDRETFPVDMGAISWKEFVQSYIQGLENFKCRSKSRAKTTPFKMLTLRLIYYTTEALFITLLLLGPVLAVRKLGRHFGF